MFACRVKMFNVYSSSLLVAAVCILGSSKIAIASDITYKMPKEFTVEISNHERATITRGKKLKVNVIDREIENCLFTSNFLELQSNRVTATFREYLRNDDDSRVIKTKPVDIFDQIPGMIFLAVDQTMPDSTDSSKGHCNAVFLPLGTNKHASTVHPRVSRAIRLLAESCVETNLCLVADLIAITIDSTGKKLSSYNENNVFSIFNPNFSITKIVANESGLPKSQGINGVVDATVEKFVDYVRRKGLSQLPVPDSDVSFPSGEFHAKYGKFRDLTTLRRKSDVVQVRNGNNLSVSCEFGPEFAEILYDYYEMSYGWINSNGWLVMRANDLTVDIGVVIDFSEMPCVSSLDHVKVIRMGQLEISLTGFGWLNWFLNNIVSDLVTQYSDEIARTIEEQVRYLIDSRFIDFDCEIFRPFAKNTQKTPGDTVS